MFNRIAIFALAVSVVALSFISSKIIYENRDYRNKLDVMVRGNIDAALGYEKDLDTLSDRLDYVKWMQGKEGTASKHILSEYGIRVSALESNWNMNIEREIVSTVSRAIPKVIASIPGFN